MKLCSLSNLLVLLALGPLACGPETGAEPSTPVDSAGSSIVGGALDANHPAVVALLNLFVGGMCSGTLVTPTVVVTAAHCVVDDPNANHYKVFFGSNAMSHVRSDFHAVSQVKAHPLYNATQITNDIAVVVLSQPAPVAPMLLRRTPLPSDFVGQTITIVGFGITSANAQDSGIKRVASATVTGIDPPLAPPGTQFELGNQATNTCSGDSGGPAFWTVNGAEVLVGVTSYGVVGCQGTGADTRVDAYMPFLDPFVSVDCPANGVCMPGCNPPDPDCAALGQACVFNAGCESQRCGTPFDGALCTRPCGPSANGASCPSDFLCLPGNGSFFSCIPTASACAADGQCVQGCGQPDPDCLAVGAACDSNDACQSDLCLAPPSASGRICVASCDPTDASSCPKGQSCAADGSGAHYCNDPTWGSDGNGGCLGCSARGDAGFFAVDVAFGLLLLIGVSNRRRRRS